MTDTARHRRLLRNVALTLAVPFGGAACAAGEMIEETVGSVAEQVQDGVEAVPVAANLACSNERQVLQTALDTFALVEGTPPAVEADLVSEGYLRTESVLFDLGPAGALVPAPGSTCT